jgi:sulfane dehydrogenase subunit SoxC
VRTLTNPKNDPRTSQARTPHQHLAGTITPAGLHFVVSRTGFPDIDPAKHRLAIHGLVKQPLVYDLDGLARYPMVSRIHFVECGGNSAPLYNKDPIQADVQAIHGLLSCSQWTGVKLSTLLEETGIDPKAKWLLAEGADGPSMNRSIPIAKALDDAMIALYQNGERIRPEQGYPMRLLVPGYEGNMNVKWLHRIKLIEEPVMAINETLQYTYRVAGPKIWQFFFPMEVKSFVTHPSPGLTLKGPGFYEISGLAYSGNGRIAKVMVSADGGKSWAQAALDEPVLPKALARFRLPWRWDGQPVVLMSRAWDESGNVQPTRDEMFAERGAPKINTPVTAFPMGHMNVITSWAVDGKGEVKHVYG